MIKKLTMVCLVCLMVLAQTSGVYASAYKDYSSAFNVELGKTYTRTWTNSNYSHNYYNKVVLKSSGELTIQMEKPADNKGNYKDIEIHIYDHQLNTVWKHHTFDNEDLSSQYYTYTIGLKSGTYYVNIIYDGYIYNGSISSDYKFTFKDNQYIEIESNESYNNASVLNAGHMYKAYFGTGFLDKNNNDIYKFYVSKDGYYKIAVDNFIELKDNYLSADLLNNHYEDVDYVSLSDDFIYDNQLRTYTYNKYLNKGTYYFKLSGHYGEPISYNIGVYSQYCLNNGHQLGSIKQITAPTLTNDGKGVRTCTQCGHNTIVSIPRVCQFSDVRGNQWYFDTVVSVNQLGLMSGASETLFKPDHLMNRAMVACVFHRIEGSPSTKYQPVFKDLKSDEYYSQAVTWAKLNGVINGYENGTYKPLNTVSREEMITMIYNFAKYKNQYRNTYYDLSEFKDYKSVSYYAKESLQWAVANNIISGKDKGERLDPQGSATRAECAKILLKGYELIYK